LYIILKIQDNKSLLNCCGLHNSLFRIRPQHFYSSVGTKGEEKHDTNEDDSSNNNV